MIDFTLIFIVFIVVFLGLLFRSLAKINGLKQAERDRAILFQEQTISELQTKDEDSSESNS